MALGSLRHLQSIKGRREEAKEKTENEGPEMVEAKGEGASCKPREDGVLKMSGQHLMATSH